MSSEKLVEKMLIDGQWVGAQDRCSFPVYNPATGEIIAHAANGAEPDVDLAVAAARRAYNGAWRTFGGSARAKLLWRIADLIERDAESLARLETLNNGMPFEDALGSIRNLVTEQFRYCAGWSTRLYGRTLDLTAPGISMQAATLREPVGVVGLIIPWNSPLVMAAMKLAPALAAGCTAVLKPAEETPLTALRLGELLVEAGVPAGVVNIVTGLGHIAGAAIAAHDDIDKVAFTGSTEVGRRIVQAASGNLKKVTLELGGKSPVVVFADADIERVSQGAARAIFRNAGQICHAGTRLFVARPIYDAVIAKVADIARSLRVGNGFDKNTQMGPLISRKQQQRVQAYISGGRSGGADIISGSAPTDAGFFVAPTIVSRAIPDMAVMREEIFGPVLSAAPFDEFEEAVGMANDTLYGLAASVWTRDIALANRFVQKVQAGQVGINAHTVSHPHMPFGGYRQSGWGRENGADGIENYLQTKTVFHAVS